MLQIVWFKRDLRVHDHAPLAEAAARGPVLPLYVVEPELWRQPDMAPRHWAFIREALISLDAALAERGAQLLLRRGASIEVLDDCLRRFGPFRLWSHEETGNGWTYARDRAVAAWCRARGIDWQQRPQFGVIRGLRERRGWASRWERQMTAPPVAAPPAVNVAPKSDAFAQHPDAVTPTIPHGTLAALPQIGGRADGLALLDSFLTARGTQYHRALSSPNTAFDACSRLSPHLACGTLSLREVVQATRARRAALDPDELSTKAWRRALAAFDGRLHWHCHFIQKLESQPSLEFDNAHRAYDGLRENSWNDNHFEAWQHGRTGWPFVDACMRALSATGWLNFRMRAMLVAVSSYHLWLHWRQPALHLARLFVDYEPGIHYSQVQMQSGTSGINTVRIYNPIKQGLDHDSDGVFIRRWVPELAGVPTGFIHQPWTLSATDRQRYGAAGYPLPLVEMQTAARQARDAVWAVRRAVDYRREADAIQSRHGSRRAGLPPSGKRPRTRRTASAEAQLSLDLPTAPE